jgi:hypothetical protein
MVASMRAPLSPRLLRAYQENYAGYINCGADEISRICPRRERRLLVQKDLVEAVHLVADEKQQHSDEE